MYTYARQKRGGKVSTKKMGRPTDNPRPHKISIRINNNDKNILETYCLQNNVNKTEAISRGIQKLESEIKK